MNLDSFKTHRVKLLHNKIGIIIGVCTSTGKSNLIIKTDNGRKRRPSIGKIEWICCIDKTGNEIPGTRIENL